MLDQLFGLGEWDLHRRDLTAFSRKLFGRAGMILTDVGQRAKQRETPVRQLEYASFLGVGRHRLRHVRAYRGIIVGYQVSHSSLVEIAAVTSKPIEFAIDYRAHGWMSLVNGRGAVIDHGLQAIVRMSRVTIAAIVETAKAAAKAKPTVGQHLVLVGDVRGQRVDADVVFKVPQIILRIVDELIVAGDDRGAQRSADQIREFRSADDRIDGH